jgi:hypothetical protein
VNLEGSHADAPSLRNAFGLGVHWLKQRPRSSDVAWDQHCNSLPTRWILSFPGLSSRSPAGPTWRTPVPRSTSCRPTAGCSPPPRPVGSPPSRRHPSGRWTPLRPPGNRYSARSPKTGRCRGTQWTHHARAAWNSRLPMRATSRDSSGSGPRARPRRDQCSGVASEGTQAWPRVRPSRSSSQATALIRHPTTVRTSCNAFMPRAEKGAPCCTPVLA